MLELNKEFERYITDCASILGVTDPEAIERVKAGFFNKLKEAEAKEEVKRAARAKESGKTEREIVVEIAKKWKGHEGVNYETTSTKNLLLLIEDAVDYDQVLKTRITDDGK